MSSEIDIRMALRAFQNIVELGEKRGNKHYFKGVSAYSDLDGYNVDMTDDKVTLSIYFHSKYNLDYKSALDRDAFLEKLGKIDTIKKHKKSP